MLPVDVVVLDSSECLVLGAGYAVHEVQELARVGGQHSQAPAWSPPEAQMEGFISRAGVTHT
jgi:hypothetical protein